MQLLKEGLQIFTESLTKVVLLQHLENTLQGVTYEQMRRSFAKALPNILTCLNMCLSGKEYFALDYWPFPLFIYATTIIRPVGSVAECHLFAQRYELLLDDFL